MKKILSASLAMCLAGVVGCANMMGGSSETSGTETSVSQQPGGEAPSGSSDASITTSVKEALRKDGMLGSLNIDVSTSKGVVTLSGNVPDALAYNRAISVARAVPGVRPPVRATNLVYPH